MKNIAIVIGLAVTLFPQALAWYVGNWITYSYSYFKHHLEEHDCETKIFWIFPMYQIFFVAGSMSLDLITQRIISVKTVFIVDLIIEPIVFIISYFVLQHSLLLLIVTFSVINGLLCGLKWAAVMVILKDTFAYENFGKAIALPNSLSTFGGVAVNVVLTLYINPENLEPNVRHGNMAGFAYKSIYDRVPDVFLMIGLIFAVCNFTGWFIAFPFGNIASLLWERQNRDSAECSRETQPQISYSSNSNTNNGELTNKSSLTESCSCTHYGANQDVNHDEKDVNRIACASNSNSEEIEDRQQLLHVSSRMTCKHNCCPVSASNDDQHSNFSETITILQENRLETDTAIETAENEIDTPETTNGNSNNNENGRGVSMIKVLTSPMFIILWISSFAGDCGYLTMLGCYKLFGELWIRDDHLLVTTGYTLILTSGFGRLIIGLIVDRVGLFKTFVGLLALNSIGMYLWYFSIQISTWLFLVWTSFVAGACSCGIFNFYPVAILRCFGSSNYSTNMSLLLTSYLAAAFVTPPVTTFFVQELSLFWLFQLIGILNLLPLILLLIKMFIDGLD